MPYSSSTPVSQPFVLNRCWRTCAGACAVETGVLLVGLKGVAAAFAAGGWGVGVLAAAALATYGQLIVTRLARFGAQTEAIRIDAEGVALPGRISGVIPWSAIRGAGCEQRSRRSALVISVEPKALVRLSASKRAVIDWDRLVLPLDGLREGGEFVARADVDRAIEVINAVVAGAAPASELASAPSAGELAALARS